ncbi:uncharacterized protein AMSG_11586 [Thecamonas trahens ATCC 50062]|uniref:Uncharacterized protein n=1 Tax=Thecamonas trahens ATCC 50062 TaxID=461836 RepID=A0A0L0D3N5_THETB|nr:hypothetical protein AMSG_11586 [Thecamonas trahens ATCC 50062]KNC45913.1 hypothetical protein AMSG_11586 [Thecamonas trahens ATCC 50062]|eukprot:XP_013763184.1 hypothetical protein AMSG_11586 [Thecamonas trahens ATCC 50062]
MLEADRGGGRLRLRALLLALGGRLHVRLSVEGSRARGGTGDRTGRVGSWWVVALALTRGGKDGVGGGSQIGVLTLVSVLNRVKNVVDEIHEGRDGRRVRVDGMLDTISYDGLKRGSLCSRHGSRHIMRLFLEPALWRQVQHI